MIKWSISILIVVVCSFTCAQQALVDNVEGQWLIYNKGERHLLDQSIHDLGNFDEFGFTYFLKHDTYGIINEKGEILLDEKYKSVQQLGGGYYLFLEGKKRVLASSQGDNFEFREISRYSKVQDCWSIVQIDTFQLLLNTRVGKEWKLEANDEIYQSRFNYVYCSLDDTTHLFGPNGNSIKTGDKRPIFDENYLLLQTPTEKKVIYENHEVPLPINTRNIRILENEIIYTSDGQSSIISSVDGRVIATFPFEEISYYERGSLTFRENGMIGLMTKTGKVIIPARYSSITKTGDVYTVRTSQGAGVVSGNGQQLVPCVHDYVRVFSDYFTIHNSLDLSGLISRKTQKTLLPCAYSSIVLNDTVVRAFASDLLRILELDSNHRVVNDLVLSNVTSLVNTRPSTDADIDKRLFPLGWFTESVPTFDKDGYRTGEAVNWGLKDSKDSILRPARYKQPFFVENADFSLMPKSPRKISLLGLPEYSWSQFEVTSVLTGRSLVLENVVSLDTTDLLTRNYSRFISSKGYGILLGDNSILRVNYFDSHDPTYLRFCTSRKVKIAAGEKKDYDKVQLPDFNMNNDPREFIKAKIDQKECDWVRFENAEWNFLDTTGKKAFPEPFDYAEPYKFETAIVMREGRSGVVRADSAVVSIRFASVNRSPISDTLFVVQKSSNIIRYLDTNGRRMTRSMTRFYKNEGNLTQVEWNSKKVLIDPNYEVVSGETRFQKLMGDDIFYSKENKQYTIYNAEGRQLGEVPLKPEEVWFDQYVMTKSRGKKGILSVDGDTLIPFKYKKIEKVGDYVFAQDGADNLLFNNRMEQLENLKTSSVLVDSITGQYAKIKTNKAIVCSSNGKKIFKAKGMKFEHFHNGFLIEMGKQLRVFGPEIEFVFDFQPRLLQVMADNGYLVEDASKTFHYFDENWEEVQFVEPLRRVKYVGSGLALARQKTQSLLFGGDVNVSFEPRTRNVGTYQGGFLLIECNDNFQFINTEGINEFKSMYDEAQPFFSNYATVKESSGWTIIDRKGNFQILPNFDEITPESPTIFSTRAQPVYGLFDSHGNELIPTEFQQLFFLRNNIIQGRKGGDIFYFDITGTPIELK